MAVDKSRGDIKKETWKRPDQESNPGPLGNKQERYPLCYAAPPPPVKIFVKGVPMRADNLI